MDMFSRDAVLALVSPTPMKGSVNVPSLELSQS